MSVASSSSPDSAQRIDLFNGQQSVYFVPFRLNLKSDAGFDSWVGGEKLLVSVFGAYNRTLGLIFRDFECQESTEVAIVGEGLSDQGAELRIGDGSVEIPCVKLCYQQKKATLVVPSVSKQLLADKDLCDNFLIKTCHLFCMNLIKKHIKGGLDHEGGIFTVEAPLHASNVQVVDPVTRYIHFCLAPM